MNENNKYFAFVPLMPDGKLTPAVMLEQDVIDFLRMREVGIKNPANTLRYYREKGKLKPTRIGGHNVYTLDAIMEFLEIMTKK